MHKKYWLVGWLVEREGKGPLRRPRHRWKDNTGLDHRGIEWEVGN
jgi:hypothetical protein